MRRMLSLSLLAFTALSGVVNAQGPPNNYWVYVASESEDEVSLIRFGPGGLEVEKTIGVALLNGIPNVTARRVADKRVVNRFKADFLKAG